MPIHEAFNPQFEEEEDQDQPSRRRCRHIFNAGTRCGSPCLRTEEFCYYHHTTRRPVYSPRERRSRTDVFDLPNPEDREGVRAAVTQVMHAIAHNNIDVKRAGMILYSLQIALCSFPPQPRPVPAKAQSSSIPDPFVEDMVHQEPHGFIALEDDYKEPEVLKPRRTLGQRLLDEVERYEARHARDLGMTPQTEEVAEEVAEANAPSTPETASQLAPDSLSQPPGSFDSQPRSELGASPSASETWNSPLRRPDAIDLRASAEPCPNRAFLHSINKCHPGAGQDAGHPARAKSRANQAAASPPALTNRPARKGIRRRRGSR